jgi:hypothetical protein
VPPKQTQHMQPALMQAVMHSQQAWHMAQQSSSPLVQVMQTPIFVSVHSHLHMARLHWHMVMPFIMHEQLHMLPAIILHMFCSVAAESSSSQVHVIFMPPLHFSIFIVQRGTMHICMLPGAATGMLPAIAEPPMDPIIPLSITIMLVIRILPCSGRNFERLGPQFSGRWLDALAVERTSGILQ